MEKTNSPGQWSLTCHLSYGDEGAVCRVSGGGGGTVVQAIESLAPQGEGPPPVFLGVNPAGKVILMDAGSRAVFLNDGYPANAAAPYAYRDEATAQLWFTIDGDKATGCDPTFCSDSGAPVLVLDTAAGEVSQALLKLICMGRGHHVVTFTAPCEAFPGMPRRAFVSNLLDGNICVVGNDPADADTYLRIIDSINLGEAEREKDGGAGVPNNAFPHGKVFSPRTGKIYNLNNGYGTIAVIDPVSHAIERRVELKGCSNLLLSPCGRYLIGKGADRKADAEHVMGRLAVVDALEGRVVTELDVPDFYPSTYRFSPDGSKLYVTSAATGKGAQRDNLNIERLQVYDAGALPALRLLREVTVGRADCGRRPIGFIADADLVLVPNPSDGTLSLLDGASDQLQETVTLSERPVKEFSFSFWDGGVSGS